MKSKHSLLILFVFCFSLIGCQQSDNINGKAIGKPLGTVLCKPDKIIIYNKEKSKELDKNDTRFDKIVELTNERFHNKLSTGLDIIDESSSANVIRDGLGVEFIYSNEQELSINGDGFTPFKYNKLYFQLTSEKYGDSQGSPVHWIIHGDKDRYKGSSNGPLKYSKELVDLVKGI